MADTNRIVSASEPFLTQGARTVAPTWYRFLAALARNGSSDGGAAPYFIPAGEVYTVPVNKQVLFAEDINVEGGLVVDGHLLEVT